MIAIDQTAINLAVAAILVANVGLACNWRQRLAGLRTDTLVAIGAVSLVIFAVPIAGQSASRDEFLAML